MKKILFLLMIITLLSVNVAFADVLKEGSLYCVSLKKVIRYDNYVTKGREDLAKRLIEKSDCYIKEKDEEVFVDSKSKEYVQIELLDGFSVWTNKENLKP